MHSSVEKDVSHAGNDRIAGQGIGSTPMLISGAVFSSTRLYDFWSLTKPEVNFLILVTTFAGFYLGSVELRCPLSLSALFNVLLGTSLVASGAATSNQYVERKFDAEMRRTSRRPAASGRVQPNAVLAFGCILSILGTVYLEVACGTYATGLSLLTLLIYLFVYTPLKRRTPLCMMVGAVPGAIPPLIGWAAASGRLTPAAWWLFAIVFLWQFPHFMAIAWMYREDYDRAGYLVLPRGRPKIVVLTLQTVLPLLGLVVISAVMLGTHSVISPSRVSLMLTSLGFLYFGVTFLLKRSRQTARRLLAASIIYLPLVLAVRLTLV